ncbi:MAG: diguanylate cyclase [Candidatus Electronema sp. V4]|uniref:diguanylate cyclase n=1 Tax=Candidatus Electronema sp. V4 TaxID=3454756 RepID=UPI0040554B8A
MISRIIHWAALHCRRRQGKLNMRLSIRRTVRKNKKLIICLSLIVLVINTVFLFMTFMSLRETLFATLLQKAERHEEEFKLNLKMVYSSMLQMSSLISSNSHVRQALLRDQAAAVPLRPQPEGKKGEQAGAARKTYQFGSVEDRPQLLSDNMQSYTWLHGVSPVWAVDPVSQEKVYVGALDISTSFRQIVPLYSKLFQVEAAVLLNKDYVRSRMWNPQTKAYFEQHPEANHYVEAVSSPESMDLLRKILPKIFVRNDYALDRIYMVYQDNAYYSVYYFPLPDAQEDMLLTAPAGFMLIWENVSEQVGHAAYNFFNSMIQTAVAFMLIEIGLLWILNRETRLSAAEECAAVDELTGLFNRRYFDELLDNELNRVAKSQETPLSLIVCDVDYFKRYNDTYGHKVGDDCLRKIADSLRLQARRSSDCVARYGGEEFVIVLPRTDLHAAADIAETARKAVQDLAIPHASSEVMPVVTITLGVACTSYLPEYESLFEAADRNLYLAKNNGRNRVEPAKVAIPPRKQPVLLS